MGNKIKFNIWLLFVISTFLFIPTNALAKNNSDVFIGNDDSMPIPIKLVDRTGDSSQNYIEACIDGTDCFYVKSVNFGGTQTGSLHIGGGGGAGRADVQDILLKRVPDEYSAELFRLLFNGGHTSEISIAYYREFSGNLLPFIKYILSPVMITSVQLDIDDSFEPVENVTLNFAKISIEVSIINDGNLTGTETLIWNIETNNEE